MCYESVYDIVGAFWQCNHRQYTGVCVLWCICHFSMIWLFYILLGWLDICNITPWTKRNKLVIWKIHHCNWFDILWLYIMIGWKLHCDFFNIVYRHRWWHRRTITRISAMKNSLCQGAKIFQRNQREKAFNYQLVKVKYCKISICFTGILF